MDLQKSNMTVLAQIVKQIPAKIIDPPAKNSKFRFYETKQVFNRFELSKDTFTLVIHRAEYRTVFTPDGSVPMRG